MLAILRRSLIRWSLVAVWLPVLGAGCRGSEESPREPDKARVADSGHAPVTGSMHDGAMGEGGSSGVNDASAERDAGQLARPDAAVMTGEDADADGAPPTSGVDANYVFTPCQDTGPECPCPRGTPWPWPSFMPEPDAPELYCTPDGRVASAAVKPSERIPVTCASVCLAFSIDFGGNDYHGLCDQFGTNWQLCVDECKREWTPEQTCCRAERVSSQKSGIVSGQLGVPGFLSCGRDDVDSHYSCGQIRRPDDPFFADRYAACGAMGGRR